VALPGTNPSAEARVAAIVHGFELDDEPSAEVREARGVYRLPTAAL
jgi:hypothetical protein